MMVIQFKSLSYLFSIVYKYSGIFYFIIFPLPVIFILLTSCLLVIGFLRHWNITIDKKAPEYKINIDAVIGRNDYSDH